MRPKCPQCKTTMTKFVLIDKITFKCMNCHHIINKTTHAPYGEQSLDLYHCIKAAEKAREQRFYQKAHYFEQRAMAEKINEALS